MKQLRVILWFFLLCPLRGSAQDSLLARMIFIGDAGERTAAQQAVIRRAASQVIRGKTTVLYLGDNIYPRGLAPDGDERASGEAVLRSEFGPMRRAGATVCFLPGNHDWDRMGPEGLQRIMAQGDYLAARQDSLLRLLPPDGCPDPQVISVTDSTVIVAWDSEWWLFPFDKENPGADCDCSSPRDVVNAFREILYRNRGKTIILAMHHPFYSKGTHGGHFTWKDYLFPLTAVRRELYIPLPVIGAIYPLYRKLFPGPEDLHNPLYKEMTAEVSDVFKSYPNVLLVSGHDHGLQLIRSPGAPLQIVSGGGAKHTAVGRGIHTLFSAASEGYVVCDVLTTGRLRIRFFRYEPEGITPAYTYTWHRKATAFPASDSTGILMGDSVIARAHPAYNKAGWFSRLWFGNNYRREWAAPVKLPVLHVSRLHGGLRPEKLGGGFQSTSLRMKDTAGIEYTLRSVEKSAAKVLPEAFRGTFALRVMDDATSGQHPYSALIVPPIAHAVGVPHATPVIGVVSPDKNLGMYEKLFAGKVTLLEEREPLGNSDNFIKTTDKLLDDNDNRYDAVNFTRARMIDLLLGDWDRHGDQWRFYDEKKGKGKDYIGIPRDRDMALNLTEGIVPYLVKRYFLMPHVPGFRKNLLPLSRYYFYKSGFLSAFPSGQLSYDTWMTQARLLTRRITDSVISVALHRMPDAIYRMDSARLTADLIHRRDQLPEAVARYYHFSNRIVDIRASDKNEWVQVADVPDSNAVRVVMRKISKHGKPEDTLMDKVYPRVQTRELRIYLSGGDDSVVVNDPEATVRLRLVGGKGHKAYRVTGSRKPIRLYDRRRGAWYGEISRLRPRIRDDSVQTAFVPTDLYNTALPLVTGAINADDGLYLGAGVLYTGRRGFRKTPYSSRQQLMVSHAFSTSAFRARFSSEWIHVLGRADVVIDGDIRAPNNTQNFFGRGNTTPFDKREGYKRYYRTRFNDYQLTAALRWRGSKGSTWTAGPTFEYYHLDPNDNKGRFIEQTAMLHSYDSLTLDEDKMHLGGKLTYVLDRRDNTREPTYGVYLQVGLRGLAGLNDAARSFVQLTPELALYKSLNRRRSVVVADRLGGTVALGKTAFYQSAFLGGQGNLLGYRKYRFSGQHALYNNTELRVAVSDFGNYILKGQLGLAGFYDIGRVWQSGEHSRKWHQGAGGGIYFLPAYLAVFRFYLGYSSEGWYPYVSMGFRF